jgi:hypothetical protein
MLSRTQDVMMGLSNEGKLIETLKRHFCAKYNEADLEKTTDPYAKWDFEGTTNGTLFEMKSRRNTKFFYPTTVLPVHKIMRTDKTQVFVFHFKDKTCYIEYDRQVFSKFTKKIGQTFRDGRYDPPQEQFEIPVELLIDLEEIPLTIPSFL